MSNTSTRQYTFPILQKVADLRDVTISRSNITLYLNPAKPIDRPTSEEFPLTFKIADGLDGSGCHTIYNQPTTNTFTNSLNLFCFKPISIHTVQTVLFGRINPLIHPSLKDLFYCAATECEENIRSFMESMIYPDTAMLQNGITLENSVVNVYIIRSMFDGKMAAILSGARGASCEMCTAVDKDLKDQNLVLEGFPINRKITNAIDSVW
ncbi:hypothetical protein LOD99_9802 [Oopsacas minuta]|uniref:Uncharacterized protein n=1 Tax=Oopsacas minuta TaxID=111878 RepID=A0AAV7KLX8_9METZ|nr:hypothetical protein LOD99_9802 [Oopsacas minuta]